MNPNQPAAGTVLPDEKAVIDYLKTHPDFFLGHDDLLARLMLPHRAGKAVSLIERQVSVLRNENRGLRRQLEDLVQIARSNEELIHRLQQLALRLLDCGDFATILHALEDSLQQDFHADAATLHLYSDPADRVAEYVGSQHFLRVDVVGDDAARAGLQRLLTGGEPVCGALGADILQRLFGERAAGIASTALLPLTLADAAGSVRDIGLLAIGSGSNERFNAGMGTTYLRHLGELIARRLAPCLLAPA